jgi:hypothetical protein
VQAAVAVLVRTSTGSSIDTDHYREDQMGGLPDILLQPVDRRPIETTAHRDQDRERLRRAESGLRNIAALTAD